MENDKQAKSEIKSNSVDASSKPCMYCKGEQHSLLKCRQRKCKPHKENILRSKGLCFACLKHGHMSSSCKDKACCEECSRLHPTMLHIAIKDSKSCEQQVVSSALAMERWSLMMSLGPVRKTCSFHHSSEH